MTFYKDLKARIWKNTNTMIIMTHCYLLGYVIMSFIAGNPIPRCNNISMVMSYFIGGILGLVITSALQVSIERKYGNSDD